MSTPKKSLAETKETPLSDLKPAEWNPRKIDKRAFAELKNNMTMRRHMLWDWPVLANKDGTIYSGNMRYRAAESLGWKEIPARVKPYMMTLEEMQTEAIIANTHAGKWVDDELRHIMRNLYEHDIDLKPLGIELKMIDSVLTDAEVEDVKGRKPVYSDDLIIREAFKFYRAKGFPYRKLALHVCLQEINKLAKCEFSALMNSNLGYHVADTYHPHRFAAAADGKKSPLQGFEDDKLLERSIRLAIENGDFVQEQLLGTMLLVSGVQSCSNFRPGFASYMYRKYCKKGYRILDTSTGYGGRLIGFIASNLQGEYIGIDPNTVTHKGNERMAKDLGASKYVTLINKAAEDVKAKEIGTVDFSFTSPPYFSKEHYSEESTQSWKRYPDADDWRKGFLQPMLKLQFDCLKKNCIAAVNIQEVQIRGKKYPIHDWCVEDAVQIGFKHEETLQFDMSNRYGANLEDEVASEPVFIFRKK